MDNIFIATLFMAFGVCLYLGLELRQSRQEEKRSRWLLETYRLLNKEMGFYFLCYDIVEDVVTLSPQCRELLHIPGRIEDYSHRRLQEAQQPGQPLFVVAQSLSSPDGKRFYRYHDEKGQPRRFQLFTKIFEDEDHRPEYVFGIFMDVTKQFQTETKLEAKARLDGLTRVNNSGATRSYLGKNVGTTDGAALMLLDIDYFKTVNDRLGHQKGDRALVIVSNVLKQVLKGEGFIGRLGGDEFCCYLGTPQAEEKLIAICEAVNEQVRQQSFEQNLGMEITVSIGVAVIRRGDDYEKAYAMADRALYNAKEKGRDTYAVLSE